MPETTTFEDQMNRRVRYSQGDREVLLDEKAVQLYGLAEMLKRAGLEQDHTPLPVVYCGEIVGTLPASFDPRRVKSCTFLYQAREGDFRLEGGKWVADRMLGPGDLYAAGVTLRPEYRAQ